MIEKQKVKSRITSRATAMCVVNMVVHSLALPNALASSDADYSFMLTSDWHDCQQIGSTYQAVYAFETASFYINICQSNDGYFYSGEAKQSEHSSIFIPAYPLENGQGFQAKNGNVSYLVLLPFNQHLEHNDFNPSASHQSEAVLTIKRNGQLISVESSLNKYCYQSETQTWGDAIELNPHNHNQLATIPRSQDTSLDLSGIMVRDRLLPAKIFNSDLAFDFYRIGGKLHRLTTCTAN